MTNPDPKTIERVRKLLSLSHSDNENEAAQAAGRAAQMMAEHEITEAMCEIVQGSEDAPAHVAEQIVDAACTETEKRVAWRETIASAVARSLDCETYISGAKYHAVGRATAVATWGYVSRYLFTEVERLADEAWVKEGADLVAVGQRPRAWKNGFRVGAASTISNRLYAEKRASETQRAEHAQIASRAAHLQLNAGTVDGPTATTALVLASAQRAIAVVDRDRAEVKAHYQKMTKDWRTCRGVGATSSRSGYSAGREAGKTVDLSRARPSALGAR